MKPVLYVCAPFATRTLAEAALTDAAIRGALELGYVPVFAPYLYDRVISDTFPSERELALQACEVLIAKSDAFLVVGDRLTAGMERDLAAWRKLLDGPHDGVLPTYRWPELPQAGAEWWRTPRAGVSARAASDLGGGL